MNWKGPFGLLCISFQVKKWMPHLLICHLCSKFYSTDLFNFEQRWLINKGRHSFFYLKWNAQQTKGSFSVHTHPILSTPGFHWLWTGPDLELDNCLVLLPEAFLKWNFYYWVGTNVVIRPTIVCLIQLYYYQGIFW